MEIDRKKIQAELGLDDTLIRDLFSSYLEETTVAIGHLEVASSSDNFEVMSVIGHSLKGMSANLRITLISETARSIEKTAKDSKNKQTILDLIELMKIQVSELSTIVASW